MSTSVLSLPSLPQPSLLPERAVHRPTLVSTLAREPRHVASHALLDGARELVIQHQGGEYHLRLTRNDKLILTK
ncbi:hemin uptake protein HemP [Rhodanobacter sp. L36]|uniref:hemin uptake protein HemP n=1 Tax=Rhodanobacter sp. L36 TaxID=1747221 RepID=UPI00131CE1D6|nr:hemin uptake protein HemP [Rhodanobacter sp. L36]